MAELEVVGLNKFELKQIAVKAKGNRIYFEWKESHRFEDALTQEIYSREAENILNFDVFTLIERLKPFISLPDIKDKELREEVIEHLTIENIKFFNDLIDDKQYEIDITYKAPVFSDRLSKNSTGRQSVSAIVQLSHQDRAEAYNELQDIITEFEANAYQFCVLKTVFPMPIEELSLGEDGQVSF